MEVHCVGFVTGGYGFIGSWVAKRVLESGDEVVIYDIVEKNYDYLSPYQDRITFIQGDILDYPHLSQSIQSQTNLRGIVHSVA